MDHAQNGPCFQQPILWRIPTRSCTKPRVQKGTQFVKNSPCTKRLFIFSPAQTWIESEGFPFGNLREFGTAMQCIIRTQDSPIVQSTVLLLMSYYSFIIRYYICNHIYEFWFTDYILLLLYSFIGPCCCDSPAQLLMHWLIHRFGNDLDGLGYVNPFHPQLWRRSVKCLLASSGPIPLCNIARWPFPHQLQSVGCLIKQNWMWWVLLVNFLWWTWWQYNNSSA